MIENDLKAQIYHTFFKTAKHITTTFSVFFTMPTVSSTRKKKKNDSHNLDSAEILPTKQ
jgi:hypothetical protein